MDTTTDNQDLEAITGAVRDAATVKRVFGDPIEHDGVTVIPVAKIGGGGGAGGGGDAEGGGGRGGGFGLGSTPIGVYVIKDGDVRWIPTYDVTALAGRALAAFTIAAVTWRSASRARQRRKRAQARSR